MVPLTLFKLSQATRRVNDFGRKLVITLHSLWATGAENWLLIPKIGFRKTAKKMSANGSVESAPEAQALKVRRVRKKINGFKLLQGVLVAQLGSIARQRRRVARYIKDSFWSDLHERIQRAGRKPGPWGVCKSVCGLRSVG